MATNRPQGDLVGLRITTKHFQQVKTIEISLLDEKNILYLYRLWDSSPQTLVNQRLAHRFNPLVTTCTEVYVCLLYG